MSGEIAIAQVYLGCPMLFRSTGWQETLVYGREARCAGSLQSTSQIVLRAPCVTYVLGPDLPYTFLEFDCDEVGKRWILAPTEYNFAVNRLQFSSQIPLRWARTAKVLLYLENAQK